MLLKHSLRSYPKKSDLRYSWLPFAVLGSSLLSGAASLISGNKQSQGQREANATNIQIAREQNAFNRESWNMENEYNTPSAQMRRLKDAGLNPNLVYGSGQAVTAASSQRPAAGARVENARTGEAQGLARMVETIMQGLIRSQEIQQTQARTELMKTQADLAGVKGEESLANIGRIEASSRNLDSSTNLNVKRLDEIDSRIRNIDSSTLLNDARQHGQEIYNSYAAGLHHTKIQMQETANAMSQAQIAALAERVAQAWRSLDIQAGRLYMDQSRLSTYQQIAAEQINAIRAGVEGTTIRNSIQKEHMDYKHVNAFFSALKLASPMNWLSPLK